MLAAQAGSDENNATTAGRIAIGKFLIQRFPDSINIQDKQGMNVVSRPYINSTISTTHKYF